MNTQQMPMLPLSFDIESKAVLKKVASARSSLAELKGAALTIPNEQILINTLFLQEAKDSSAIENIITTNDELFQFDENKKTSYSIATKEVYNYKDALQNGFNELKKTNMLTVNQILHIQSLLKENQAGFRKLPGTVLKNEQTNEIIYTPPQNHEEIVQYMNNLEKFINDNSISNLDPLIKMAIIHHQFESIHPFYDGNGRTGRIINVLYLVKERLLDMPILYLSRYINNTKNTYYNLLQKVREENKWEEWVLYILEGVEQTSQHTLHIIKGIKNLMLKQKHKIREEASKNIYSQDLLNNIFKHPYTKIDFMISDLNISRNTAIKYLDELIKIDILYKKKLWKENYYINKELYDLFSNVALEYPLKNIS